jgi:hypothetical protein
MWTTSPHLLAFTDDWAQELGKLLRETTWSQVYLLPTPSYKKLKKEQRTRTSNIQAYVVAVSFMGCNTVSSLFHSLLNIDPKILKLYQNK